MQEVRNVRNMEHRGIIRRDYKQRFYLSGHKFHQRGTFSFFQRTLSRKLLGLCSGHFYRSIKIYDSRCAIFIFIRRRGRWSPRLSVRSLYEITWFAVDWACSWNFKIIGRWSEIFKVKIWKFHREKVAVQLQRMIKICYDQISSKTGSKKFKCLELGAWNLHEISWIIWNEEILRFLRFWIPTSVKIYIRNSAYQILETCRRDKNLELFKNFQNLETGAVRH